jgi:hypothetical protein
VYFKGFSSDLLFVAKMVMMKAKTAEIKYVDKLAHAELGPAIKATWAEFQ